MGTFERPSAYGSCTFKPVVREASLWPIGCPEVAGTSQSGVQVGRRKPVIQGGPAGEVLSGSPGAGYGREREFAAAPGSCLSTRDQAEVMPVKVDLREQGEVTPCLEPPSNAATFQRLGGTALTSPR
jgi:hypothetical protein